MQFNLRNLDVLNEFPIVTEASKEGLLAYGGDLSVERLVTAYKSGIFPWYEQNQPILWWSPDPRFVLYPEKLKISKSTKKFLKETPLSVTINRNFNQVITACSEIKREGQYSTWITNDMLTAYCNLHDKGFAISVEVWRNGDLVGGLYGVDWGNGIFSWESMFSKVDNASKLALVELINQNNYKLIDCQVYTSHLASLGAEEIPRVKFIKLLK